MRKTSVFVSSTCYDLRSLREHLRTAIDTLGHDPVLSEYPSFPVSPELSTVENCKKVVRDRADLFVLIVGGKRGALDAVTQRSVVNAEYREAKKAGLDCFVFVERQVWDLIALYKKNPEADFSPTVDSPGVFDFLDELINDTKWIFQFQRTEEIIDILKQQLSIRFQDLLCRARENRLTFPPEFIGESNEVIDLVINKGALWEYRLAHLLLKDRMARIDSKFSDIARGFVFRSSKFLGARDTMNHIENLFNDLTAVVSAAAKVLSEEISEGFGPPGIPGDAARIKRGCDSLYSLLLGLYEWELDVRFVRPHEVFADLLKTMQGWSDELLSEFHRLPRELGELLGQPNLKGHYSIMLKIKAPSGISEFTSTLKRLSGDPRVIAAIAHGR
jgi:hypothetical protein